MSDTKAPRGAWGSAGLPLLTGAVSAIAAVMCVNGQASVLEAVSFVTGAVCVWLTVRESVWNFPIGLVNTATFFVVFVESRLYGDATLQVIYFILGLSGWHQWLFGGQNRTALLVSRAPLPEMRSLGGVVVAGAIVLWQALHALGGAATFWDATTTSLSLGAQWLLNRKRVQNWDLWILADAIYVPLYLARGLTLTAMLYAVFLGMAFAGRRRWRGLLP